MKKRILILLTLVFTISLGLSVNNTTYQAAEVLPWSANQSGDNIQGN